MKIILASGSPRRRQLFAQVGIPCEVVVSGADETISGAPDYQVRELALRKACAVQRLVGPDDVIIAADTLVYIDGMVLGKPESPDDAFAMLKSLSGRCHTVYTGVAVLRGEKEILFADTTLVYFRELSDEEIWGYIATGEPFDKAGAYGVQDKGALLVDHVEGDYFTVVGLPVAKVAAALREMGYDPWRRG
ncbi:MAG: Maf family protein [Defluviitaleaceae bacterium]|nr:Maf family protein [Defluviitaleaceae bacterium]